MCSFPLFLDNRLDTFFSETEMGMYFFARIRPKNEIGIMF
jgi:hypothetical protein